MKKVDMIVKAPHFFTMEGEGVGYVGDAVMLIDGGKIPVSDTHLDVYKRQMYLFDLRF